MDRVVTGPEFKRLREQFGSQADAAAVLNTPLRTLQDWERPDREKVPGVAVAAMGLLLERTDRVVANVIKGIEERINRDFPNGIVSVAINEEEE